MDGRQTGEYRWYNKQSELKRQAGKDLAEFDKSMRQYYIATLDNAPKLSDFYHRSEEQKHGELTFVVGPLALLRVQIAVKTGRFVTW